MPDKNDIQTLIEQYLTGTLSPEDKDRLQSILDDPACQQVLEELADQQLEERLKQEYTFPGTHDRVKSAVLQHIRQPVVIRRLSFVRKWGWAAAILLLIGAGVVAVMTGINKKDNGIAEIKIPADVAPGRNGAVLTLANGDSVVLDSLGNGVIATQNGAQVILHNGSLSYAAAEKTAGAMVYNLVATPKGRQFRITLPDGTEVWLNAASTIRYPTTFAANERQVEITGEAYFEVTKNAAAPFRVVANKKAVVEVLGTSFNINAYRDEAAIKTTLLEGAVRVKETTTNPQQPLLLKPGQQAQISNNASSPAAIQLIRDADISKTMAWKSGLFDFENARLEDVMRQLSRWYDIEIVYPEGIPDIEFVGKINKSISLNGVLRVLERAGVHFRLEGKKLFVQSA